MGLLSGHQLGPYEIVAAIGAGGMGEVYRARDPRLGRDVAIKVLPSSFSADPDRLHRFEQEARAAAALNHPNILAVHDIGSEDGAPYIVSELLEGATLRERLSQGSATSRIGVTAGSDASTSGGTAGLPVRKAVEYAVQIARGLSAAHDKGIVHRDLKPENVFVTSDGQVKILDFGLAKLTQADSPLDAATNLPTTPATNTHPGMILGTIGYMAPEQVRGLPVDHRADIFAFGVILYELLSGQRAFKGATTADTIIAIVKEDPPDLPIGERHIPPALGRIVDRCLEKAPAARFQTATDLAFALESLSSHSDRSTVPAAVASVPVRRWRGRTAWAAAAVGWLAAVVIAVIHFRETPPPTDPVMFQFRYPENTVPGPNSVLAISPDGKRAVFVALSKGVAMLWVRPVAALEATALPRTDGAAFPFWSPDSRSIAFFAGGKLKTVQLSGGLPVELCDASDGRGGTWNDRNTIVFAPSNSTALQRVASAGGTPAAVTTLVEGETRHLWPWFLPDGEHFVYIAASGVGRSGALRVGSLGSKETMPLGPADSNAQFASGHLFFVRSGTLMAERFDPERRQFTGEPFPIAEQIVPLRTALTAAFSVSASGALGYRSAGARTSQLTWFERTTGKVLGTVGDPGGYPNLALSPDEHRLAVSRVTGSPPNVDIWVIDLVGPTPPERLTTDPEGEFDPTFSPNGSEVAFSSARSGTYSLYRRASNSSGQDTLVLKPDVRLGGLGGADWSHNGRFVAFGTDTRDVWVLPLFGDHKPFALQQTPTIIETDPAFSPDSQWIAYSSNKSGQAEVYVQSFPADGVEHPISHGGGRYPTWCCDGREIFFLAPDGTMMVAGVDTRKPFQAGAARRLFQTGLTSTTNNHPYVVTKDGQRFLFPAADQSVVPTMTVELNWLAGAQK